MKIRFWQMFLAGLLVMMASDLLWAATPLQVIRQTVDQATAILADKSLRGEAMQGERKARLLAVINPAFDYQALSQRAMGRNWRDLSDGQRQEFADVFSKVLINVYIDKIMAYEDEKVVYGKEILSSDKYAEVQTRILAKTGEIPINYRLLFRENSWQVYDVVVEGVGLVSNYRSQFNDFLRRKSTVELIEALRKKL